jgi:hypothetical protein
MFLYAFAALTTNLSAQNSIIGSYKCDECDRQLTLNADHRFILLDLNKGVYFYHLDTLSFGTWRQENNFVVLNTPKSIESQKLKIIVEESFNPNSDSLVLEIFNPYENFSNQYEKVNRVFSYLFFIDSYESKYGPEIYMKGNRIALPKLITDKIVNLNLTIVPNSYLYPCPLAFNYLTTDMYTFRNRDANYIKIDIPDFTFNYIGYLRFDKEYVRIKNSTLLIRGKEFKKSNR